MEVKPGYKETEVGVIPEEWGVCRLSSLILSGPKNGYSGRSGKKARGTPTLTLSATTSGRMILNDETVKYLEETLERSSGIFLESGDVLVQRSNTPDLVGMTAIFEGPSDVFAYPDLMMRLRFRTQETAHWFWRYANSSSGRRFFVSVAAGSTGTMPKISGDKLRKMPLPLPNAHEQRTIATALSDVDAMLDALDRLIAKKRDLKQAAMQRLLTGHTRLPGFGGEWSEYSFDDLFAVLRNASNSRADLVTDGDIGYLHYGDIHTHQSPFFDCCSDLRTFLRADRVRTTPSMADGDLVMVDASEDTEAIGKAVEIRGLGGRCAVAGLHTLLLRPKGTLLADGFKGYLQFLPAVRESLVRMATGVSVYGITRSNVRTIRVTIPGADEQRAIAAVLADMESEIAVLEGRLAKTRDLKQGMVQELLTGRIRLV